ncbi:MAG: response regulator [Pararhodobacter sp.]
MRYRVLIVEDDPHWQSVFANLIAASETFDLACTAGSLAEARKAVRYQRFDAALVDLGLPDGTGHEVLQAIARHQPEVKAAVCTIFEDPENVMQAIRAGASGYIIKAHLHMGLLDLLQQMLDGGAPLSPRVAHHILNRMRQSEDISENPETALLTRREIEVLGSISNGLTLKQSAAALGIAESTVRTHVKSIYSKLGVTNRAAAVLKAWRPGRAG